MMRYSSDEGDDVTLIAVRMNRNAARSKNIVFVEYCNTSVIL